MPVALFQEAHLPIRRRKMCSHHGIGGFTIVELITVVLLLGILSVTAISRFVQPSAFAPGIITHAFVMEARAAQQLAVARADAQVTLTLDQIGNQWRLRTATNIDGVVRDETINVENTSVTASSGTATGVVSPGTPLVLQFDSSGDLSAVFIGAAAGTASSGVDLLFNGDSNRAVCVYPSGYTNDAACA